MKQQHIYQNIQGWFNFPELYQNIVSTFNDNSHFVEIGTWLGQSASFMAAEIINSGKKIKFDCIDTWQGSAEHQGNNEIQNNTLFESFLKNINPVKHIINPIRASSLEAVKTYKDLSLDFVFIDAAHDYENVIQDIRAWYPKVKKGGILAGHDYHPNWSGVIQAVNTFLTEQKLNLNINSETCWGIVKE